MTHYSDLVLKLHQWPERDRQLWEAGLLPGDLLEGEDYAASLSPITVRNTRRGYGRWLAALSQLDPAALTLEPTDRVTPARARAFLGALRARGNTNNTIKQRFWQLQSALRIIAPIRKFDWLNKPAGRTLHTLLPTTLRHRKIVDTRELISWGEDLMEEGLRSDADPRIEWFRNGLLVSIFAARAPRERSMASLRIDQNLFRRGEHYYIAFAATDTKANKGLAYPLPDYLTPRIDHYLDVVRPKLLGTQDHDWFWVNRSGERLAAGGITSVISRGFQARFGFVSFTHAFRHALATTSLILKPTHPGAISAVLGNAPYVASRHYDLGGQVEAAQRWQRLLHTYLDDSGSINPTRLSNSTEI